MMLIIAIFCVLCAMSWSGKFDQIRHSPEFVDKTLLIKELFTREQSLVIAAPGGFGKTTNLDMVRNFLNKNSNQTLGQILFHCTEILKKQGFTKNLENLTALYCSLKQEKPVVDYKSMLRAFRVILYRTFSMYSYLGKSKKLSGFDKKELITYAGVKKHLKSTPAQIVVGLHFLAKLLKQHHGKDVVLLLDDYDNIILDSIFTNRLDLEMVLGFHNAFFSATVHKNDYIKKSIFAGITCTCVKSLKNLEHLQCIGFMENNSFVPFFGITETELDHLLEKNNFKTRRSQKEKITNWYGGYKSYDLKTCVYSIKSTLSFLRTGKFQSYWSDSRVMKTVNNLLIEPDVQQFVNDSIHFKIREIQLIEDAWPQHMKGLKRFLVDELWNEEYADIFIYLLMEKGFFTFESGWVGKHKPKTITIKVPNKEISKVLKNVVKSFLKDPVELLDRLKDAIHKLTYTERNESLTSEIGLTRQIGF